MYLFFNEKGKVDLIHYTKLEGVDYNQDNCLFYDGEIPHKDGFNTFIFVNDGNVEFDFVEIPKSKEEILQAKIEELDRVNKANMLALMEVNSRLNRVEGGK